MPIDYLSETKKKEQEVKDLLASQAGEITSQAGQTRENVIAGRKPVLDRLTSYASGVDPSFGSAVNAGLSERLPGVNRKLDSSLARQQLTQERTRQNLLYQNLYDLAKSYGLDSLKADEFARQYLINQKSNEFAASEAEKNRQQQLRQADLADKYADIGIGQANASQSSDSTGALLRVLLGTGTAIGTGYALNKSLTPKTSTPSLTGNYNSTGTTYRNLYDNSIQNEAFRNKTSDLLSSYGVRGYAAY